MRMCTDHWDKIKAEVDRRGLSKFVANGGEEAVKRMLGEHAEAAKNFDPLMGAHNLILSAALGSLGAELMFANEDGTDKCPLCELQKTHDAGCKEENCTFKFDETWIPGPVGEMYDEAVRMGLIASV